MLVLGGGAFGKGLSQEGGSPMSGISALVKETPKNWCCQTVVLEKTLESPLDCKEIKSLNPKGNWKKEKKYIYKGNWPWISIRKTDAEVNFFVLFLSSFVFVL